MSVPPVPEIPFSTVSTTHPGGSAVQYTQYPSNATVTIPPRAVIEPTHATNPPKYEYVPNDFMVFSTLTLSFCCFFSPLIALMCGLPAVLYSLQSRQNAQIGAIEAAKKQGIIAAYLNIITIITALVVACIILGLVVGLYFPYIPSVPYNCNQYNYECYSGVYNQGEQY